MNRLSDNDRNWGPFTLGSWHRSFSLAIQGRDDDGNNHSSLLLTGFGYALRVRLPLLIEPSGKYHEHQKLYGMNLSDMGNGYDFLQVYYGQRTHDSSTDKSWCYHLPWKQWRHVRYSVYTPSGELFCTEKKGEDFLSFMRIRDTCPQVHFGFEDYDGEMIVASCRIEEREWKKGEGWFKWLQWFSSTKTRRSLDIQFSSEMGPGKGSWKGGTIGHGIDMKHGETPRQAFERYCQQDHPASGRKTFRIRFVGPCNPPAKREYNETGEQALQKTIEEELEEKRKSHEGTDRV